MTIQELADTEVIPSSVSSRFLQVGDRLHRELTTSSGTYASHVAVPNPSGDALGDWWRAYWDGQLPSTDRPTRGTIRTVELFSGTGGLGLGFRQACTELAFDTVSEAAVDHDAEAVAVHRQNLGTRLTSSKSVSMLVDSSVRGTRETARFRYEPEMLEPQWAALRGQVDAVLAGPPCQGHSNLNNKTRRTDPRNELYLSVPAIAIALDAPIVVIENVPAVQHDRVGVVAATTALLGSHGYRVTTGILRADRMGWPQARGRFFLVARRDRDIDSIAHTGAALADTPRDVDWALGGFVPEGPAHMFEQPELSDENRRRLSWLFDNDQHDLPFSERPECHQDGTTYTSVYGRMYRDRPAPTITTGFMTPGRGRYIHPTERRVLYAAEAARVQGFPSTYNFMPHGATPSKAQLGKWIGDAVPMPLGFAAGVAALAHGPVQR